MKNPGAKRHLKNNLDSSFNLSDDEFEQLRSEYEEGNRTHPGNDKGAKFAKIAGLIFLVLGILFLIQQFLFPFGPDLRPILRLIPSAGTVLVIVIGLGLLAKIRSIRKETAKNHTRNVEEETSGHSAYRADAGAASEKSGRTAYDDRSDADHSSGFGSTSTSPEADEYDEYAFHSRQRWYRSRKEKMIFGVCGGIAERFDTDPTIVRALFALAFFSYGFSFVIYIVLAILLPKKPLKAVST